MMLPLFQIGADDAGQIIGGFFRRPVFLGMWLRMWSSISSAHEAVDGSPCSREPHPLGGTFSVVGGSIWPRFG
jgi:hypothetical protein